MEIYDTIIKIIDINFTYCLIPLLLTIILIEGIFKNRFQTKQVLNLIRWFIISYTVMALIHFLIGIMLFPDKFEFFNRATGPYKITYWLMLLSAVLLPFTLFYKKLGLKPIYLLFIAVFMKMGWYFERFVILVASYHSSYLPDNGNHDWFTSPMTGILMLILQGFILAILLLGIFELIKRKTGSKLSR